MVFKKFTWFNVKKIYMCIDNVQVCVFVLSSDSKILILQPNLLIVKKKNCQ